MALYRVGLSGARNPVSRELVFRTAAATADAALKVAVLGDMGVNGSADTMARLARRAAGTAAARPMAAP